METNFACHVAYLKFRQLMQSIEQDEVFFDTRFNKHTELYEEFKLTVVLPLLAKHSIS